MYGVPVKAKELFGVLHLKGFVIDDTLLYSGASLNNVYLQYSDRYRLDRYFLVSQSELCDSVVDFIESTLLSSGSLILSSAPDEQERRSLFSRLLFRAAPIGFIGAMLANIVLTFVL